MNAIFICRTPFHCPLDSGIVITQFLKKATRKYSMNTITRDRLLANLANFARRYQSDINKIRLPRWERLMRYPLSTVMSSISYGIIYPILVRLKSEIKAKTQCVEQETD